MIHVTAKVQTSLTNATDQSYEVPNKIFNISTKKTYEVYEYNDWNPLIFLPERAISVADFTGRKKRNH